MYLKKIKINNFRKFRVDNNVVEFVDAENYLKQKGDALINIAPITTLIVGKNNSGKTTITKALEKLIIDNKFEANDFNFKYLREKLTEYHNDYDNQFLSVEPPFLEFTLTVGIEQNSSDLVTNLVPFMTLENVANSELDILIKYELVENENFHKAVKDLLDEGIEDNILLFKKFVDLLSESLDFKIKYYNTSGTEVSFRIKDLIEIKAIKANNVENEKCLSRAFSKIVEYRYRSTQGKRDKKELERIITEINGALSSNITDKHTNRINTSLNAIESSDKLEMILSSDISFKKLMNDLIKYEYIEYGDNIPETQFGLGYTNLMMIIADLIEYMEKYPEDSFNSKVNLISIEEPETFMHPQMQELFIKNINEAISSLLKSNKKNINSQLIITTHSSHILNSKIHSGNSFDNINYVTTLEQNSNVVSLNDKKITPQLGDNHNENNLKFLKKHIKYKVSELFFSDAIILVEGVTEETLLRYYLDNETQLNKFYISIFNIDGAHGLVYHELIKLLKIPALVITDLDIKRTDTEKETFTQISSLDTKTTTNATIKQYNKEKELLTKLPSTLIKENLKIAFQGQINGFYATSFEEAFILTNFNNQILQDTIKELKPDIYNSIVGTKSDIEEIKNNSYKLQRKLSGCKSDFANKLLFKYITSDATVELPLLPQYVTEGLTWLSTKLNIV
jgi:putative ATP-dependent endonuclease of OLD family